MFKLYEYTKNDIERSLYQSIKDEVMSNYALRSSRGYIVALNGGKFYEVYFMARKPKLHTVRKKEIVKCISTEAIVTLKDNNLEISITDIICKLYNDGFILPQIKAIIHPDYHFLIDRVKNGEYIHD